VRQLRGENHGAFIEDPVAGYRYLIDSVHGIGYRLPLEVRTPPARTPQAEEPPGVTYEQLGMRTMFGVTVVGDKRTVIHPAGSDLGNDRPVATSNETWLAPSLGNLLVYYKMSSPGGGENITTLNDLTTTEPDASLFRIPDGYKIVDVTEQTFTITIPAHK
jgi:hypothetical protein